MCSQFVAYNSDCSVAGRPRSGGADARAAVGRPIARVAPSGRRAADAQRAAPEFGPWARHMPRSCDGTGLATAQHRPPTGVSAAASGRGALYSRALVDRSWHLIGRRRWRIQCLFAGAASWTQRRRADCTCLLQWATAVELATNASWALRERQRFNHIIPSEKGSLVKTTFVDDCTIAALFSLYNFYFYSTLLLLCKRTTQGKNLFLTKLYFYTWVKIFIVARVFHWKANPHALRASAVHARWICRGVLII